MPHDIKQGLIVIQVGYGHASYDSKCPEYMFLFHAAKIMSFCFMRKICEYDKNMCEVVSSF